MSCWLTPAASQIPVESWAAREMSSRAPTRVPAQVGCRVTLPSRQAVSRAMPSVPGRIRPCTGTVQWSRLMSLLTRLSPSGPVLWSGWGSRSCSWCPPPGAEMLTAVWILPYNAHNAEYSRKCVRRRSTRRTSVYGAGRDADNHRAARR